MRARNDLELLDLKADSGETENRAAMPNPPEDMLVSMNAKFNALIEEDVGVDDDSDLPGPTFHWRRPETVEIPF